MSDYNSSLPVRTENNGDVAAKIVDGTTPSQALSVDGSGRIVVKVQDGAGNALTSQLNGSQQALDVGINVAGVQIDPRDVRALTNADVVTVEQGTSPWVVGDGGGSLTVDAVNLDIRDLAFATDSVDVSGSSVTVSNGSGASAVNIQDGGNSITVDGTVTVSNFPSTVDTDYGTVGASTIRTAAQVGNATGAADFGAGATGAQTLRVSANILDEAGNAFSNSNPLPVYMTDSPGDEVNDYLTSAAIAANASSNHDYTVTALKTLQLMQISASASGKAKIEVRIETAAGSGTFNTKFVQFNSTANPNMEIVLKAPIAVPAGAKVRVIRTNKDNQSQDLYSTISGIEE